MEVTQIPQNQIDQVLAFVMEQRADNIRELLIRNGYAQANTLAKPELQTLFLQAIKDSEPFRNDVSAYLAGLVQDTTLPFIAQPRQTTFEATGWGTSGKPKGSKKINAIGTDTVASTSTSSTSSSGGGGSFWGTLGSVVNKDTLTALFNTGLGAVSTKLQSSATKSSEQNALELERIRLQQIQAQSQLAATSGGLQAKTGLSTGAIVGIAAGGVAVLALIIILATKKK